ncbi:MAG TPA: hypothetical protein PKH54_00430 [Myxococcota bacterium]|nr:hypothetical protein [Myxococcota bacterium]HOA13171.1 hypothetical protein [Myxococcota bacterium]HOC98380.1 hypothetical protein [Myxococcota bacterium]HOH76302.1 hypothetical protein [Myxococcota bacterium]HPV02955.1 hypothetical protein [Myxococcota bacterium]
MSVRLSAVCPALSAALFLAGLVSCDSSRMISGIYQSDLPVVIDGVPGLDTPRYFEMMLAQFGPDITGIVRVYDDADFLVPSSEVCPCRFVENGKVESSSMALSFRSHGDCPGSSGTPLIIGRFTFKEPVVVDDEAGELLSGTLELQDAGEPGQVDVTFRRARTWRQVGEADLKCGDPLLYADDPPETGDAG